MSKYSPTRSDGKLVELMLFSFKNIKESDTVIFSGESWLGNRKSTSELFKLISGESWLGNRKPKSELFKFIFYVYVVARHAVPS